MKCVTTMKNLMVLAVAVGCLAACQSLGIAPADTFNKKWAEAQQTNTAVLAGALALAKDGKITPAQLKKVEAATDSSQAGLDLARQLKSANPTAANDRLSQIVSGLTAIQAALDSPDIGPQLESVLGK